MSDKGAKFQMLDEEANPTEEKERIFFEEYADAVFKFDDGREIKFNKMLLFWKTMSLPFKSMLFGPFKQDIIEIKDCTYETFKLFLDCLIGVKKITEENALDIFPLSCKYMIKKCTERCATMLEPKVIDSDACQLLNVAVYYHFRQLVKTIKNFAVANNSHYKFLEVKEYRNILSLEAFKEVVHWLEIDSCIFINILEWCENHLKQEKDKNASVKNLLKSLEIFEKMKIEVFECGSLLNEFTSSELGKNFFSSEEIASYHEKEKKSKHPDRKYKWLKCSAGTKFTEFFEKVISTLNRKVQVKVEIGKIIMYDLPKPSYSCEAKLSNHYSADDEVQFDGKEKALIFKFKFNFYEHGEVYDYKNINMYLNLRNWYKSLKLQWKFEKDCRILLVNRNPIEDTDESTNSEFYFTQKIVCDRECKS